MHARRTGVAYFRWRGGLNGWVLAGLAAAPTLGGTSSVDCFNRPMSQGPANPPKLPSEFTIAIPPASPCSRTAVVTMAQNGPIAPHNPTVGYQVQQEHERKQTPTGPPHHAASPVIHWKGLRRHNRRTAAATGPAIEAQICMVSYDPSHLSVDSR